MNKLDENIAARKVLFKQMDKLNKETRKLLQEKIKFFGLCCPQCGKPVTVVKANELLRYGLVESDPGYNEWDNQYPYECKKCDENYFTFECVQTIEPPKVKSVKKKK